MYAWGDSLIRLQDYADEFGDSILQKMVEYGQSVTGGIHDRPMVPEFPSWVRTISKAVSNLGRDQRIAVTAYYSAQLIDGRLPAKYQIAREIGMKTPEFEDNLHIGRKNLLKVLNH